MTRYLPHPRFVSGLTGQSLFAHFRASSLVFLFATQAHVAFAAPDGSEEDSTNIIETTITEPPQPEVSDRESRLRNMEDELLKQLSVDGQPSAQEESNFSLADVKHVSDELVARKETAPQAQKKSGGSTAKSSLRTTAADEAPARVPMVTYDEETSSSNRIPQASSVVPVSAKSVPHRKPAAKRNATTEGLSARDLEHRLAIAETQLSLLTQELESTKEKLATSEARARELALHGDERSRATNSEPSSTNDKEVRAAPVKMMEPGSPTSVDTEVARVTKNRSPLRIGPGLYESIITHLYRDNVVTIEHRTGGWYRIVTSDGTRGWIAGNYLVFDTAPRSADSTVHVGAYEPNLEMIAARR
jgi:hypothetical protein